MKLFSSEKTLYSNNSNAYNKFILKTALKNLLRVNFCIPVESEEHPSFDSIFNHRKIIMESELVLSQLSVENTSFSNME